MSVDIDPDKYITFKRQQFTQWCVHTLGAVRDNIPSTVRERFAEVAALELTDAVVIRKQDQFAPAALYAYANAVTTAAEILDPYASTMHDGRDVIAMLDALAEYFTDQAHDARAMQRKLPT